MSIKLSEVLAAIRGRTPSLEVRNAAGDPSIGDVASDSRQVGEGTLFCCIRGEKSDGHDYAAEARERGALALLCERDPGVGLPAIVVPSVRDVMGDAAAAVYDRPAEKLLMVGVTGTNGKTTTTYILRSILQAAGIRTGLLGTIVESDGAVERDATRTTPESCVVQRRLADMVRNRCAACVMETSSHGLTLGRLRGASYDVPVFTNLNPEHLDFHKEMEDYFQAKRLLFTRYVKPGFLGAVNGDDPYGRRLLEEAPEHLRGFSMAAEDTFARVSRWSTSLKGTEMRVEMRGLSPLDLMSPLSGEFNVWNVLCAVTALRGRVSDEAIVRGVALTPQVPGRLERYVLPNGACCFVDFAHTPTALKSLLTTVRALTKGRVISVFGHGGGRYPLNRPALGRVAGELADHVIVTMDNPRDEDPAKIASEIEAGIAEVRGGASHEVILDRGEAVRRGLERLSGGDVLTVSGKGPERYLERCGKRTPYNDAETVQAWLRA